jgi:hypothetical protein
MKNNLERKNSWKNVNVGATKQFQSFKIVFGNVSIKVAYCQKKNKLWNAPHDF